VEQYDHLTPILLVILYIGIGGRLRSRQLFIFRTVRQWADHDFDAFMTESVSAVRRLTDAHHVFHIVSL